jgi:thiamine-monophosphate kinase
MLRRQKPGARVDAGYLSLRDAERTRTLRESGIDLEALPLADGVAGVAAQLGVPAWELAAGAGEDYELCVCLDRDGRDAAQSTVPLTFIGSVQAGPPVAAFSAGGRSIDVRGFHHRL